MNQPEKFIEKSALVLEYFGHWPSFYHSEIISLFFYRNYPMLPKALMRIYVFEKTLGSMIHPILGKTKHCLLELEFLELGENHFSEFNSFNKLAEIRFRQNMGRYFTEFLPVSGARIVLESGKIRIRSLKKIGEDPKDTLDKY